MPWRRSPPRLPNGRWQRCARLGAGSRWLRKSPEGTGGARGGMGWDGKPRKLFDAKARKKHAPKNGGGPEGTPPERLRYGMGSRREKQKQAMRYIAFAQPG